MCLDDTYSIIMVNDKSRKIIALTMDKTVAVCRLRAVKSTCNAHLKCSSKHDLKKIMMQCTLIETEDPYCNRSDLIVTICHERTVCCMNCNEITFKRITLNLCNST